jgi:hypothetical protein
MIRQGEVKFSHRLVASSRRTTRSCVFCISCILFYRAKNQAKAGKRAEIDFNDLILLPQLCLLRRKKFLQTFFHQGDLIALDKKRPYRCPVLFI